MTLRTRQLETASTVSLVVVLLVVVGALRHRQTVTPSRVDLDSKAWARTSRLQKNLIRIRTVRVRCRSSNNDTLSNGALLMTGDVIDLCCTHCLLSTSFGEKGALGH